MPLYRFRIDGPLLKSIVNAYRQLGVEFYARFTHEGVFTTQMDMAHVMLLDLRLTPRDFRWFTPDELWVTAEDMLLWGAVKGYKKGDVAVVEIRDDRGLWIGDLKVGRVVEEEEVTKFEGPLPKVELIASFRVVTADFSRIVKNALADRANKIGIYVDRPECLFMFLDERVSRVDASRENWLIGCSGRASAFYSLDDFAGLLLPALSPSVEVSLGEDLPCLLKYSNDEFQIRYWLAPKVDTEEMKALFKAPKPERVFVFEMGKKLVEELQASLKAINPLLGGSLPKMAPMYQVGFYVYWSNKYQIGSLKLAYERFERFRDIEERLCSELYMTDIIPFLKNVETLELYLEKEGDKRRFVFVGRGPKIAEKELVLEAVRDVDVPKVEGAGVFSGPNDLLRRTVEDVKLCEDDYLVFYTTAYEIVAFGENHVYYSATFELDSFKPLEEVYLAIKPEFFDNLITFFRNIPTSFTVLGRKDYGIYLSSSNYGLQVESYLYQSEEDVKKAVERYQERIKPKPPVEVKPLVVPPTPEEVFKELTSKVSAVNEDYEKIALKFREEEEAFYRVEKKPKLEEVKRLIAFFTGIEPQLDPLKTRYESLKTQLLDLYKTAKLELMREIDRVVGGEINPNLRNIDFFKGRIVYLLPILRRIEKELEVVPPKPPVPPKIPKIPEEGITDEWLIAVQGISPEVKPEAITHDDYTYSVLLNKYIEELRDTIPMGIMPLGTPPDVEAFLKRGEFEGWKWKPEDITYTPQYVAWREMWFKTYTKAELEPLTRVKVDEIARVKKLSTEGKKEDVISRILGIPVAPPPVAPPPPKPPPKPKPVRLKPEEVEEVWKEFAAYARMINITEPLVYRDEFDEVVRTAVSVAQATDRARKLAERIKKRIAPPPVKPPAPPVPAVPLEELAEVYRRLKLPFGAPVSRAMFETVSRAIVRERIPPAGLITAEVDYLRREFSEFLRKYGVDPDKYRRDFEEAIDRDLNLDENLNTVMSRAREIRAKYGR